MITRKYALGMAAGALMTLAAGSAQAIECIAPSAPGGGWDFTCRSVSKLLYDLKLVDSPIQVNNITGATGAVAFSAVAQDRAADGQLLVATSTMSTVMLAQGKYPGDVDTMRWVATLGTDVGVVVVNKDSRFKNLQDLVNEMKAKPESVANGGAIYDHLRLLSIAKSAGIPTSDLTKIRMVHYNGCGESIPAVMGGHIEVTTCDLGEAGPFVESGDVRVLAALGENRPLPPFENVPTAREQGFDVLGYNWRGFYVGGDVSDDDYNAWIQKLETLHKSKEWIETATAAGLQPIWMSGKEFDGFVRKSVDDMTTLSKEVGLLK